MIQARYLSFFCGLPLLAACGGGADDVPLSAFNGFSGVPLNGTYSMNGRLTSRSLTTVSGETVLSADPVDDNVAAEIAMENQNGDVVALVINGGQTFASVDGTPTGGAGFLVFDDGVTTLVASDPVTFGTEYSAFGLGIQDAGSANGNVFVGTFGRGTPANDVPTASATYAGASVGFYVSGTDTAYLTSSDITVTTTDYTTALITSQSTAIADLETADTGAAPELDFEANISLSGSEFTGPFAGTGISGRLDGAFYGPAAQEIGGTFSGNGSAGAYIGSFGAD